MAPKTNSCVGYLKYDGKLVEAGTIDARSAARALSGFDSAIRFFVGFDRPDLAAADLPLPVRIQRGSWIAEIPNHAGTLVLTGLGVAGVKYLAKAAEKMAEKDFASVGFVDVLRRALTCVQWFIRIGKHIGHSNIRLAKIVWVDAKTAEVVNKTGEGLKIPAELVKAIASAPPTLLSEVVGVVESERTLAVCAHLDGRAEVVTVSPDEKLIFSDTDEPDEVVLPELVHGQSVTVEGVVTRGNELTNTLGFWYEGRILTCRPRRGNIVRFKKNLFLTCRLRGEVSRLDKRGLPTEKKPRLIIDSLRTLSPREQLRFPFVAEPGDEA